MNLKQISTGLTAIIIASAAMAAQAGSPNQPANAYWQAPNWSGYDNRQSSQQHKQQQPGYAAPTYRQPYQANNVPPPYYSAPPQMRQNNPYAGQRNMNNGNVPPPPAGPYASQYNQTQSQNRRNAQPTPGQAPARPYYGQRPYYGPDNGASAYNTPGYNQYRRPYNNNNRGWGNNRWNNNRFWGGSGPSKWMSPSKDNWENSWDDMINTPSRMGDMPGGWSAPEVTMPNPIDMGDQMQDNVQDLPEQMKNMDVGNDVN